MAKTRRTKNPRAKNLVLSCYIELSSKEIRVVEQGCDWLTLNLPLVNTSVAWHYNLYQVANRYKYILHRVTCKFVGRHTDLQESHYQPQFSIQVRNWTVTFQFDLFWEHGLHICSSPSLRKELRFGEFSRSQRGHITSRVRKKLLQLHSRRHLVITPAKFSGKFQRRVHWTVDQFPTVSQTDWTVLTIVTQSNKAFTGCYTHVSHWGGFTWKQHEKRDCKIGKGKVCVRAKWPIRPELFPVSAAWSG